MFASTMVRVVSNITEKEAFWNVLDECLKNFRSNMSIVLVVPLNGGVGNEVVVSSPLVYKDIYSECV